MTAHVRTILDGGRAVNENSEEVVTTSIYGFKTEYVDPYSAAFFFDAVRPYPEFQFVKINLYFEGDEVLENVDLVDERYVTLPRRFITKVLQNMQLVRTY